MTAVRAAWIGRPIDADDRLGQDTLVTSWQHAIVGGMAIVHMRCAHRPHVGGVVADGIRLEVAILKRGTNGLALLAAFDRREPGPLVHRIEVRPHARRRCPGHEKRPPMTRQRQRRVLRHRQEIARVHANLRLEDAITAHLDHAPRQPGGIPRPRQRGQQQRQEHHQNRNHHQHLRQRDPPSPSPTCPSHGLPLHVMTIPAHKALIMTL